VSHHYHTITHASDYGLSAGQPSFDWGKIQVNKNEVVKGLTGGIQHLFKKNGVEYVQGILSKNLSFTF
jgi:dihydrolipoamide dehydrogenase